MAGSEEETYSTVFASLKHPIRRGMLSVLSAGPKSFSDLQKVFRIESSHLTYHLEGLGNLLSKTEDGKYALSSLGEAAVSMMTKVEEPPKASPRLPFLSGKWKPLVATMLIGLILLSGLLYFKYQSLNQLAAQYSSLKEEHESLEEALRDISNFGGAVLTYEHTVNGTITTALLKNETGMHYENGTAILDRNETYITMTTPWGHDIDTYSVYSLTTNSTLKIKIFLQYSCETKANLSISIWKRAFGVGALWRIVPLLNGARPNGNESFVWIGVESYDKIWDTNLTESTEFSVQLPSRGHYAIRIESPGVWNATDHYEINYGMTVGIDSQGNNAPFFIGNREEEESEASNKMLLGIRDTMPVWMRVPIWMREIDNTE